MLRRRLGGLFGLNFPAVAAGGGGSYDGKVLGYFPYAYWPLWEPSGGVANDISGNGFHGAYTGVTLGQTGIGDGRTCPLFDGINDFVDVYSDAFRDNYPYDEGSFAGWLKVFNAGVWSDGELRTVMGMSRAVGGAAYATWLRKFNTNNNVNYFRDDGADNDVEENVGGQSATAWTHFAMTWSVISGNLKAYLAGSQIGSTQAGVLAAQNVLIDGFCNIGTLWNIPIQNWYGWIAHPAVFGSVLDGAGVADLAVVD